ncbi:MULTISPECIES: site-specific integrase [Mammaliicoccus]|uniref:tyrosine-type recombinase/integrase n=1 Tax=unclassified Mammaliicoccus TaxID=2803851 RepID=UPI001EFB8895|nr:MULTISPECIES: site-specific integrase [Mammaliicoccus]
MTVTKRKERGTWQYAFGHEGKTYRKSGFTTKREAVEAETKAKNDLLDGFQFDNNVTLHKYFKEWAETYKEPNVSKKTYVSYTTIMNHLENATIGRTPLKDITKVKYQKFINEFAKTHTDESVRKLNGKIRSSIDDAIYEGILKKNFTYKIKYVGKNQSQHEDDKFITLKQYSDLKKELKTKYTDSSLVLFIMVVTGCRISGAINLKYDYIDRFKRTIYINEQKTTTSPRTVEVSKKDMDHIYKVLEHRPATMDGYVFSNGISTNAVNKALKGYCERLGIKQITTHAIRHTHCSYLLSKDVSIHYISKRLGHKNIKVTLEVYSHLLEESFEEENKKAVEALKVL